MRVSPLIMNRFLWLVTCAGPLTGYYSNFLSNSADEISNQPEAHFIKHILQVDRLNLLVLGY